MFKMIYEAGVDLVAKNSGRIKSDNKRAAVSAIGMGIGGFLRTAGILGVAISAAAAVIVGATASIGLAIPGIIGLVVCGVASAGVSAFGKGMIAGGDSHLGGVVQASRELRGAIVQEAWQEVRYKFGRKPATTAFAKVVEDAPAAAAPAAPAKAPELRQP
jgi:hypothetical protein